MSTGGTRAYPGSPGADLSCWGWRCCAGVSGTARPLLGKFGLQGRSVFRLFTFQPGNFLFQVTLIACQRLLSRQEMRTLEDQGFEHGHERPGLVVEVCFRGFDLLREHLKPLLPFVQGGGFRSETGLKIPELLQEVAVVMKKVAHHLEPIEKIIQISRRKDTTDQCSLPDFVQMDQSLPESVAQLIPGFPGPHQLVPEFVDLDLNLSSLLLNRGQAEGGFLNPGIAFLDPPFERSDVSSGIARANLKILLLQPQSFKLLLQIKKPLLAVRSSRFPGE
jgi:hypothetical protein